MKKTLVLGASPKPERFAFKAVELLRKYGHPVIAVGLRDGEIGETKIQKELYVENDIDTVTLYLGEQNQPQYYDYLLKLNPKRIIFNPGTENDELIKMAKNQGIETVEDCTLVMLRGNYY
ncbi:MAG TPA: CoA-binding protein [Bacteroidales bacterium]|nr:CoA-binding protein [Bacteroidales bacterium]